MKRMMRAVVVSLVVGIGTTVAARSGAIVDTFPVSFVITSAACSYLPAGTTIVGEGTMKSVTTTRTDRNGVTKIVNSSHATGTATDQDGNAYIFQYSNALQVWNSVDDPGVFVGGMTDAFTLAGPGPAKLHNGFSATFVTDFFSLFSWPEVASSHGDPIDFLTGASRCDPL